MHILYENMVVEWQLPESDLRQVERILWIAPNKEYLYCIAMEDDKAFSVMKAYSEFAAGLESRLCKQVEWIKTCLSEDAGEVFCKRVSSGRASVYPCPPSSREAAHFRSI